MSGGLPGVSCPCFLLGCGERPQTITHSDTLLSSRRPQEASAGVPVGPGPSQVRVPVTETVRTKGAGGPRLSTSLLNWLSSQSAGPRHGCRRNGPAPPRGPGPASPGQRRAGAKTASRPKGIALFSGWDLMLMCSFIHSRRTSAECERQLSAGSVTGPLLGVGSQRPLAPGPALARDHGEVPGGGEH